MQVIPATPGYSLIGIATARRLAREQLRGPIAQEKKGLFLDLANLVKESSTEPTTTRESIKREMAIERTIEKVLASDIQSSFDDSTVFEMSQKLAGFIHPILAWKVDANSIPEPILLFHGAAGPTTSGGAYAIFEESPTAAHAYVNDPHMGRMRVSVWVEQLLTEALERLAA